MYETQLARISDEEFQLTEILVTIDTLFAAGRITAAQREEQVTLARSKADAVNETDEESKLLEFDARLRALEARVAALEDGGDSGDEWPDFVAGKWYYAGDKITYENKHYVCVAPEGVVCVWSPSDYPSYWEERT